MAPEDRRGYEDAGEFGKVHRYRNTLFLPLGLFFERAISETSLTQLSTAARESLFLQYAIVPEEAAAAKNAELLREPQTSMIPDLVAARRSLANRFVPAKPHRRPHRLCTRWLARLANAFRSGWRILIDDKSAIAARVDGGLLGVKLRAGPHHLLVSYLPPAIWIAGPISLFSALLFALALWRWPRLTNLVRAEVGVDRLG
ncbi:MAG: hypothetical protein M3Y86_08365 [Verrucomicrobiota bacterium]|nr:hypothetical protein [Verrucomicrobiota bacterium]